MESENGSVRLNELSKREAFKRLQAYLSVVYIHFGIQPSERQHGSSYPEHFVTVLGMVCGLRGGETSSELNEYYNRLIGDATTEDGQFDPLTLFELLKSQSEEGSE